MSTEDRTDAEITRLVEGARSGRPRAVARLISMVENDASSLPALMAVLAPDTGRAQVIGLTGAPGVGKSTTTSALIAALRKRGRRVGVLAFDPSSPFTGGALLGDRVRMQDHALDDQVFIRSMASRGHLGGLSVAAPQALRVFDAAGCDVVLLETVGVGQSEIEVADTADTTVVLLAPGMGDGIQAAKAGVLEIGDVFAVNKADRDGSQALVREIRTMVALGERSEHTWKPPIVRTVASADEGIEELLDRVEQHRQHAEQSGSWRMRRLRRARLEVEGLALARLIRRARIDRAELLEQLAEQVADSRVDAYRAADRVLQALTDRTS